MENQIESNHLKIESKTEKVDLENRDTPNKLWGEKQRACMSNKLLQVLDQTKSNNQKWQKECTLYFCTLGKKTILMCMQV